MDHLLKTRDSRYIYRSELNKACFQHDRAHGDFKDSPRRTVTNKFLKDKTAGSGIKYMLQNEQLD